MAIGDTSSKQARIAFLRQTPYDFAKIGTGGTVSTTTMTTLNSATLTFTPSGTRDYLFITTCAVKTSATNRSIGLRFFDNNTSTGYNSLSMYNQNTSDYTPYVSVVRVTGLSGAQSFSVQGQAETLNTLTYSTPTILAIDLTKFANVYADEQIGITSTASATFQDKCTITQTTNNNRHLVIAYTTYRRAINLGFVEAQTTIDDVDICKSAHSPFVTGVDNKFHFSIYSHIPTNESHTYKIQYRSPPGTANAVTAHSRLYVIEYNDNPAVNIRGGRIKGLARIGG